MAIELISKIKPKNNGQFFLVDATDIDVYSGNENSIYPETSLANVLINQILNIDYENLLAFDVTENIFNQTEEELPNDPPVQVAVTAKLGQAILGQLIFLDLRFYCLLCPLFLQKGKKNIHSYVHTSVLSLKYNFNKKR